MKKIEKIEWKNCKHWIQVFLHIRIFFGDAGFQNKFVHQPTSSMLQLKQDKTIDCVIRRKSKGVYSSIRFLA